MNTAAETLFPIIDQSEVEPPPLTQTMYESMACPASYQASVIHKIPSMPNEFSHLGNETHDMMAAYAAHLKDEGREEDWSYFENILSLFSIEAQAILRGFIGSMKFDPRTILTTEQRFEYRDASGKPDLITLETPVDATIWDYKNYFDIIEADTFQSKLYPLLLFRHNPALESVRFVLVFLRYGKTRERTWTRDQVPYLESVLAEGRARQMNIHETRGLAKAIPGRACDHCPLLATSRCQVNEWNPRAIMTDAERLLYAIYLRAALNHTMSVLRERARIMTIKAADANGKIYEAKFKLGQQRMLPLLPALQVLNEHFVKTGENLSTRALISKTSLASLRNAKKRFALDAALTAIESSRDVTTFKMTSANPDEAPATESDN